MPDPLFHLSVALLPKALFHPRHTGAFVAGSVAPDLLSRLPALTLEQLSLAGAPVPKWLIYLWGVPHLPLGAVLAALAAAYAFHPSERRAAAAWLVGGSLYHLGLDLLQHHDNGGYAVLFPLSDARFQIGVMSSEATVPWSAPLAFVAIAAWWARLRANRDHTPPAMPS